MPRKRYSVEQIVAKLREAERLQAQGQTIAQVCKRLGISCGRHERGQWLPPAGTEA